MSDGQSLALFMMMVIGAFGLTAIPFSMDSDNKWLRVAVALWIFIWMSPPLAVLWIKGVFG